MTKSSASSSKQSLFSKLVSSTKMARVPAESLIYLTLVITLDTLKIKEIFPMLKIGSESFFLMSWKSAWKPKSLGCKSWIVAVSDSNSCAILKRPKEFSATIPPTLRFRRLLIRISYCDFCSQRRCVAGYPLWPCSHSSCFPISTTRAKERKLCY